MNRLATALILIVAVSATVDSQTIQRVTNDRGKVMHLQTALNHVTVIETSEPVVQVAQGSNSFKVEWRENKVFVQPLEPEAATNLFVWTTTQRLSYELEPAGAVAKMDFAVDQAPIPVAAPRPATVTPPPPSPTEVLLAGKPVRLEAAKPGKQPVQISIRDLYQRDGRYLIRYAIHNTGTSAYNPSTPQVYVLSGTKSAQSLYSLVNAQLGDQEVAKLKIKDQVPVAGVEGQVQSTHLEPGQEAVGVVSVRLPSSTAPTVLRMQFPADGRQPVSAFLVL